MSHKHTDEDCRKLRMTCTRQRHVKHEDYCYLWDITGKIREKFICKLQIHDHDERHCFVKELWCRLDED